MTTTLAPRFDHLVAISDARGTFEHALLTSPRREHGYCTDDMARVLVATAREPDPDEAVMRLRDLSLEFLVAAQDEDGSTRNRMNVNGEWTDGPTFLDCWGRSVWGSGTAAARISDGTMRVTAFDHFARGARGRSPWLRSMVFAGLGAAELLSVDPGHQEARLLLSDAAARITAPLGGAWPWPEPRLAYANAAIPEVLIAAGDLLDRPCVLERGLSLLRWLLDAETVDGHLSVAPVGGRGPEDGLTAFDQQSIEVAAMADACARAAVVDGDPRWAAGLDAAVAWFLGDNDGGHVMWDARTGGGYDGLQPEGPNRNEGAESTLAVLTTFQHAARRAALARP